MSYISPQSTDWNEVDRLQALRRYDILDTPREPEFDEITRVASIVCKAPIAVVNFVDEARQWFKSELGLGVSETNIDVSICAHALREAGVMVVPDTRSDPRFSQNPLVTGDPRLRFYAGARIDTPEGLPLGTVCVLDYEPRPDGITEDQRAVLVSLARQAMMLLELRRAAETRDLMGRELRHRIKNIFAVVGGLVSASSRAYPEAGPFVGSLQGRLSALAKAQEWVRPAAETGANGGQPLRFHLLLEQVLAPYGAAGERVTITGADPEVGATAATSLAMIVHEQATNAVKYGSLSTVDGRVTIDIRKEGERVVIDWRENGGPAVAGAPEKQGFGSRLAQRSAAQIDGEVTYDWREDGLHVVLDIAADRLGA